MLTSILLPKNILLLHTWALLLLPNTHHIGATPKRGVSIWDWVVNSPFITHCSRLKAAFNFSILSAKQTIHRVQPLRASFCFCRNLAKWSFLEFLLSLLKGSNTALKCISNPYTSKIQHLKAFWWGIIISSFEVKIDALHSHSSFFFFPGETFL